MPDDPRAAASAPLDDLAQRLWEKSLTLEGMVAAATNAAERIRLKGKQEGVDLALSFVKEMQRG